MGNIRTKGEQFPTWEEVQIFAVPASGPWLSPKPATLKQDRTDPLWIGKKKNLVPFVV